MVDPFFTVLWFNICANLHVIIMTFCAVHRIGRTGRCGKTGIATTFVNKMCGECQIVGWLQVILVRVMLYRRVSIA